eukprot:673921-Amphidinium_carterae.1
MENGLVRASPFPDAPEATSWLRIHPHGTEIPKPRNSLRLGPADKIDAMSAAMGVRQIQDLLFGLS